MKLHGVMLGLGLLLTGGAMAAERAVPFTCKLPWTRGNTECHEKMFSLRVHEKVTLTVISALDGNAKDVSDCPRFQVVDKNDEDHVLTELNVCVGDLKTYENPDNTEVIVKVSAKMRGLGSVSIKGTYTVTQGK